MNVIDRIILEMISANDKPIRVSALMDVLGDVRGAKIVSIVTSTDPKLKKTGNPYTNVRKVSRFTGQIGFDYENAVNNQREREGVLTDFQSQSSYARPVFRLDGTFTPFAEHKVSGKRYLRIRPLSHGETKYVDNNTGQEISKETLKPWLPVKTASATQGTEKEVAFRLFELDSIKSVGLDGKNFVLAD